MENFLLFLKRLLEDSIEDIPQRVKNFQDRSVSNGSLTALPGQVRVRSLPCGLFERLSNGSLTAL
jgi:hypothetical protein